MKKVITLIVLSAIFVSQSFGQASLTTAQPGFTSFTQEKVKITPELESLTKSEYKTHPEYGVLPYNAPCKDCYELLQKRDEKHRYFVKEGTNGSEFYTQSAYNDINYYDATGHLVTIDPRLRPTVQNDVFTAGKQPFPVTVNLHDKYASILNTGKELQVNRNLSLYIKKEDGTLISMGEPSWSDYTAGDQGVVVHNIYPGIDLEMHLGQGKVESFYRVNKPLNLKGASLVIHDNVQLPEGLAYDFSHSEMKENGLYEGAVFINNVKGDHYYVIGSPAAYDENGREKDYLVSLQFGVDQKNGYDLYVPINWMNDPNRSYPILIDPFVMATNSTPAANMTSGYGANCFSTGCSWNMGVTVPAGTTITDVTTTFWFMALGQCFLNQGAWDLTSGGCRYPTTGTYTTCNVGIPGRCQNSDLSVYNNLKNCIPAPSCPSYSLPFTLTFYRCVQPGACGDFSCIIVDPSTPWIMTVKGYKMNAYTSSTSVCQGATVGLTASADSGIGAYTYKWNPGNLVGKTVNVKPLINTTYTVTVSDCNGLDSAQAIAVVAVAPNDNPGFTISPNPACPGEPVTITGKGQRPVKSYDWTLQGATPAVMNDVQSFTATYSTTGTYSITLRDTSDECVFDSTLTITIANTVATAGPDTSVCANANVQLHATGGNTSYSWLPITGLTNPQSANPTASVSVTTTYTVTATSGNCTATATVTITIKGGITVSITPSGNTTFCQGGSVLLTANGGSTYTWNNNATTTSITVSANGPYSVVGTDAGGCTGSASQNVTVNVLPTVSVSANGPTTFCDGKSVDLTGAGALTYVWSNTATTSSIHVTSSSTYSVVGTDQHGCTGTASQGVTVNPNPTCLVTQQIHEFCQGGSESLCACQSASYAWSTGASSQCITATTGGQYTFTLTDGNGCSATNSYTVVVNPPPTVTVTPPGPINICDGDSATLIGNGASTYAWSNGATTSSIVVKTAGSYSNTGTDANGCKGNSNTVVVTVSPKGTVSIDPIPPVCLTSAPVNLTGSPAGGFFSGPGVVGSTFNPATTGVGTFTISYNYVGGGNCLNGAQASTQVTVSPQATVDISISPTIGCLNHTIYYGYGPQNVTLTANSTSQISTYQWYVNGSLIQGATSRTYVTSIPGSYNVLVTVPGGCPSDTSNTAPMLVNVVDIRCGQNMKKVILCHVPPGDTLNPQTLCIAPAAVPAHLKGHPGDCIGPCGFKKNPQSHGHHHLRMEGNEEEDMILNAYPNPFSSVTTIEFERTSDNAHMLVEVYTLTGERIATLFDKDAEAGVAYKAELDGSKLAEGVYIYRITSGDKVTNGKLVLIK